MKILTIIKKMKYSLNGELTVTQISLGSLLFIGLISNLRSVSILMHCLYLAMKKCLPNQITAEVIAITLGKNVLDPGVMSKFLRKLESANTTIWSAFEKQVEATAVSGIFFYTYCEANISKGPWNQEKFEDLLAKWVVATDQPFYMVDEPEFRDLLMYTHHPSLNLKIPHRDTIKRRIMTMGKDTVEATKQMFKVHKLCLYFRTILIALPDKCWGKN